PLFAAVAPLTRSDQIHVEAGSRKLSVTPAGNPGAVEAETTSTLVRSRHNLALIGGDPGALEVAVTMDERRRITDHARIMFLNGATQFEHIEYFLVPPGTDVSNLSSTIILDAPSIGSRLTFSPGDYDLIV